MESQGFFLVDALPFFLQIISTINICSLPASSKRRQIHLCPCFLWQSHQTTGSEICKPRVLSLGYPKKISSFYFLNSSEMYLHVNWTKRRQEREVSMDSSAYLLMLDQDENFELFLVKSQSMMWTVLTEDWTKSFLFWGLSVSFSLGHTKATEKPDPELLSSSSALVWRNMASLAAIQQKRD